MARDPNYLNLRLRPGMRDRIEHVAQRDGLTISELVRAMIEDGLTFRGAPGAARYVDQAFAASQRDGETVRS